MNVTHDCCFIKQVWKLNKVKRLYFVFFKKCIQHAERYCKKVNDIIIWIKITPNLCKLLKIAENYSRNAEDLPRTFQHLTFLFVDQVLLNLYSALNKHVFFPKSIFPCSKYVVFESLFEFHLCTWCYWKEGNFEFVHNKTEDEII